MKPLPRAVFCTRQDNLHNVMMGDVGDFYVQRENWFHVKTPVGVLKLNLNKNTNPHWDVFGDPRFPSVVPYIASGKWFGKIKEGRLWEVI